MQIDCSTAAAATEAKHLCETSEGASIKSIMNLRVGEVGWPKYINRPNVFQQMIEKIQISCVPSTKKTQVSKHTKYGSLSQQKTQGTTTVRNKIVQAVIRKTWCPFHLQKCYFIPLSKS